MDKKCSVNGQRETVTFQYEMSTMCETKPRTTLKRLLDC